MSKLKKKFLWNHNTKARFETKDSNSLVTFLCIEYKGEFMTLISYAFLVIFYKLTPQLKFNIPTHESWLNFFSCIGQYKCVYLMYSKSHYKQCKVFILGECTSHNVLCFFKLKLYITENTCRFNKPVKKLIWEIDMWYTSL